MGKVLLHYDSMKVCRRFCNTAEEMQQVCTSVFISPEWLLLDMGLISEEDALKRMHARLPEGHAREAARLCMAHWHEYCMWEVDGMRDLIKELKNRGFGIYLCSNASVRLLSCYQQKIPAVELFDGILFSSEVKCMKPQKEMYEHLYRRFDLKPEECFFIDDLDLNIQGAAETGMKGYCFADGDVAKLKEVLDNL
jgi:putative hydrolase of the HAD superfamily